MRKTWEITNHVRIINIVINKDTLLEDKSNNKQYVSHVDQMTLFKILNLMEINQSINQ